MVITTWCISEGISESDVNNDGNLGDSICNIDLFWSCSDSMKSLEIFTHKERVSQMPLFLLGQGCLKQSLSEKMGNFTRVQMN